jgi:hypothetical protein
MCLFLNTIKRKEKYALRCCAAIAVAYIGWHGSIIGSALLPLIIWLWRASTSRREAFSVLLVYYLVAGRGLLTGSAVFFSDPLAHPAWWAGALVWLGPAAILAGIWAAGSGESRRGLRLALILVVISIPPFGIFGWANPIMSAGALYPGLGWYGLGATYGLFGVLALRPTLPLLLPFVLIAVVANSQNGKSETTIPPPFPHWSGLDTRFFPTNGPDGEFDRLTALQQVVTSWSNKAPAGATLILPEAVGGDWDINGVWWSPIAEQLRKKDQAAFVGAKRVRASGDYGNVLIGFGRLRAEVENRVPVPLGMWTPLKGGGATADWWGPGTAHIDGRRVGVVICYEQLLVWPVIVTMLGDPEILVGVSNNWWGIQTSIPAIQEQAVRGWGRLFAVPVVYAANR